MSFKKLWTNLSRQTREQISETDPDVSQLNLHLALMCAVWSLLNDLEAHLSEETRQQCSKTGAGMRLAFPLTSYDLVSTRGHRILGHIITVVNSAELGPYGKRNKNTYQTRTSQLHHLPGREHCR